MPVVLLKETLVLIAAGRVAALRRTAPARLKTFVNALIGDCQRLLFRPFITVLAGNGMDETTNLDIPTVDLGKAKVDVKSAGRIAESVEITKSVASRFHTGSLALRPARLPHNRPFLIRPVIDSVAA